MPSTIRDLITSSFREMGIADFHSSLRPEYAQIGLNTLNRVLDAWNAKREAVYADLFSTFTLVSGTQPHTIGPSGATWTLSQRPVSIEAMHLIDSNSLYTEIVKRDAAWYTDLANPTLTSDRPTDFYYNPGWTLGSIYFYPKNTGTSQVRIWSRLVLSSVALGDTWAFPPGYEDALQKTLKEELALMPMFASGNSGELALAAAKARAVIFANNDSPPRLVTADAGLSGGHGTYDYRTGPFGLMR